jgi:hypothetical protein
VFFLSIQKTKVFYSHTGLQYDNLNLDVVINKWADKYNVSKILNTTLSNGRMYQLPGRQVTHYDVFATVLFEQPLTYSKPDDVAGLNINPISVTKSGFVCSWSSLSPTVLPKVEIENYIVYLKKGTGNFKLVGKTSNLNFSFNDLEPGTEYTVKVTALDYVMGESDESTATEKIVTTLS